MAGESGQPNTAQDEQSHQPLGLQLRKQEAYWHDYRTYAKERWRGRELLEVFTTEFRDRTKEYYLWAIHHGVCTINGAKAHPRQIIREGDIIINRVHRHEPSVTAEPIRIIARDEERGLLVVVKPGSIPVHACGRYNKLTLVEMLKSDHGIDPVYTTNRLDRLTSGVMVLALNKKAAAKTSAIYKDGLVRKNYVCRVRGRFPGEKDGDEIVCEEPLLAVDRQSGVNIVHPLGKPCKTLFYRMSYDPDSDTSVVWCKPLTGRTHQIRVHVQYLGHPICNDPVYGHPVWQAGGRSQDQLALEQILQGIWNEEGGTGTTGSSKIDAVIAAIKEQRDGKEDWSRWKDEIIYGKMLADDKVEMPEVPGLNAGSASKPEKEEMDRMLAEMGIGTDGSEKHRFLKRAEKEACGICEECKIPLLPDYKPEELFIYLHAVKYETDDWCYESDLPWWAGPDWQKIVKQAELQRPNEEKPAQPVPISEEYKNPAAVQNETTEADRLSTKQLPRLITIPPVASVPALESDVKALPFDSVPLMFETMLGLEDFAEVDMQNLLPADIIQSTPVPLQAYLNSGHILAPATNGSSAALFEAWRSGLVRSATGAYAVVGQLPISKILAEQWLSERQALGRSRHKDRRSLAKAKKAGLPEPKQPSMEPSHELSPSEKELYRMLNEVWNETDGMKSKALAIWAAANNRDPAEPASFRTSCERCGYLLPTLVSVAIGRDAGPLAWRWLNGPADVDGPKPWRVNLNDPELNVVFKLMPNFGVEIDCPLITDETDMNPPAGTLIAMLELPQAKVQPLMRPEVQYGDEGTPLAFHRAHLLGGLVPLPDSQADLRFLEPCAGFGRVPAELVALIRRSGLKGKVFASDVDDPSMEHMSEFMRLCDLDTSSVQIGKVNLTDADAVLSFVGGENSVDGIVTDLPWGYRHLNRTQVQALYKEMLPSIKRSLKPGGHAILMTADTSSLQRGLAAQERDDGFQLSISPLHLPPADNDVDGAAGPVSFARKAGIRTTGERGGWRAAKCGHRVGIFDLCKEPIVEGQASQM